jgi:hypothetical protein
MPVIVSLHTNGRISGKDKDFLVDDINNIMEELCEKFKGEEVIKEEIPPPLGAQSGHDIINWIVNFVSEPVMQKAYMEFFLFSLTEKMNKLKTKDNTKKDEEASTEIDFFGKKISIPQAVDVIRAFIDSFTK